MTEFTNPTDILPDVTEITRPMPRLIKDLPTIYKVVDSMGVYDNLGMVIETADTAEVIHKNKEAVLETYNLSGMLKEEMRIFALRYRKLQ